MEKYNLLPLAMLSQVLCKKACKPRKNIRLIMLIGDIMSKPTRPKKKKKINSPPPKFGAPQITCT